MDVQKVFKVRIPIGDDTLALGGVNADVKIALVGHLKRVVVMRSREMMMAMLIKGRNYSINVRHSSSFQIWIFPKRSQELSIELDR